MNPFKSNLNYVKAFYTFTRVYNFFALFDVWNLKWNWMIQQKKLESFSLKNVQVYLTLQRFSIRRKIIKYWCKNNTSL